MIWWNSVTATMTLFPHMNSRLRLGTLLHLAPWNKPIHGLELLQFATVSTVLPTCTNTLDRSRHFEPGTFLNRRHYRDFWYNIMAAYIIWWKVKERWYSRKTAIILLESAFCSRYLAPAGVECSGNKQLYMMPFCFSHQAKVENHVYVSLSLLPRCYPPTACNKKLPQPCT